MRMILGVTTTDGKRRSCYSNLDVDGPTFTECLLAVTTLQKNGFPVSISGDNENDRPGANTSKHQE